MSSKTTSTQEPASQWIAEANKDFFAESGSVKPETVRKAVVGFVVLAVGVGIILSQVL